MPLTRALAALGRHGKWVLPAGLVAAVLLPWVAAPMQRAIGPFIIVLLVVSFLQINLQPADFLHKAGQVLLVVLCLQVVLPILLLFLLRAVHISNHWQIAFVMVAAAAPITGGPSIVMMLRGNGAEAIKLLAIGTLLLPVTSFPVFALLGLLPDNEALVRTALYLGCVIVGAYIAARLIRKLFLADSGDRHNDVINGISALLLAVIVIGLMGAIHDEQNTIPAVLKMLVLATALNFGLQFLGVLADTLFKWQLPIVHGVSNGNRAVAIFLAVLPASVYEPFLLFIACYQVPMYMTPLVGAKLYRYMHDART